MKRGHTFRDLQNRFPDDDSVLEAIFRTGAPEGLRTCPKCQQHTRFYRVKGRKCYECGRCGHQHFPLKGTIMEGTKLPLLKWVEALHSFYLHRNGISACQLQRQLEVTYKVAWRMLHRLRSLMQDEVEELLTGVVEVDETYVGGRKRFGAAGTGQENKTCVFGLVERGGRVRAFAVQRRTKGTLFGLIRQHVAPGCTVYSDEHSVYTHLGREGYVHEHVLHKRRQWARGPVSTNSIEAHWSKVKRSIRGTHVAVSARWLQRYLDECSFRHNRRHQPEQILQDLLTRGFTAVPGRRLGLDIPPGLLPPLQRRRGK